VGGTALAHLVTALALPFSARLYDPAEFSIAAAFMSAVNILAVAACLRYEMAIPLVDSDEDAANLLVLSCILSVVVAFVVGGLLSVWPGVFELTGQSALAPYGWLLPIVIALTGAYLALQMWFVRRKAFRVIATSRVGQSLLGAGLQIGFGLAAVAPLGLLLGQGSNASGGGLLLAARALAPSERKVFAAVSLRRMFELSREHFRFPKFSVWEALANSASIYAPVLLITALVPGPTAGYLALATFVLQAPMALIGSSIQQVFVATAPGEDRAGRLNLYTSNMLRTLAKLAAAPIVALAVSGPALFALLFGEAWRPAGALVTWMTPWFLLQFLASPVSTALHIRGLQRTAMVLQLTGLIVRLAAVAGCAQVASHFVAEAYALSGMVFYGLYLAIIAGSLRLGVGAMINVVKASLLPALAGLAGGAAILFASPWLQSLLAK